MSDDALLASVRAGEGGMLWQEVARRPTQALCWALNAVLQSDRPCLERYHCAAALLALLRCTTFQAVDLSASGPTLRENLDRLGGIVEASLGSPDC